MRWRVLIAAVFVLAALVWVAGLVLNWRASRQNAALTSTNPPSESAATERGQPQSVARSTSPLLTPTSRNTAPPPPIVSWPSQRDDILKSGATTEAKADQLLALLPQLAGADQEEAARHLANLLSDEHFFSAGVFLTNAQAPENVQTILMNDLLNRPEKVKLPLCLAIAREEAHRHADEARKLLLLHCPEDHGTNWPAWEAAVQARLQSPQ